MAVFEPDLHITYDLSFTGAKRSQWKHQSHMQSMTFFCHKEGCPVYSTVSCHSRFDTWKKVNENSLNIIQDPMRKTSRSSRGTTVNIPSLVSQKQHTTTAHLKGMYTQETCTTASEMPRCARQGVGGRRRNDGRHLLKRSFPMHTLGTCQ